MKKILFAALALVFGLVSCVKDKPYPGITISNVSYSPTAVTAFSEVTVSATITCFNDFTAKMFYTVNDKVTEVLMIPLGGTYTAIIPPKPDGTTVSFYVEASNDDVTTTSATMSYTVGAVAVDYSVLRLNELNGNDKFIEIFNNGTEAINLNGVYIVKDETTTNWTGDNTITISAGGYILLYSEDVVNDHPEYPENLIFHSGLSAKKNVRIELFTPAGVSIDDFNLTHIELNGEAYGYPGNQAPASYSRNANIDWYYADATPGAANIDGENPVLGLEGFNPPTPPTPDYTNLVLNELNGDTKFIELYNKGDIDIPLDGMYIEKDDNLLPTWIGDGSISVPAHGYVVLYSVDVIADHPSLVGTNYIFQSGLSAKKTIRIALFLSDGTQLDIFTRGTTGEWGQTISNVGTQSYARTPDGGEWMLAGPTPGLANPATGDPIPQE